MKDIWSMTIAQMCNEITAKLQANVALPDDKRELIGPVNGCKGRIEQYLHMYGDTKPQFKRNVAYFFDVPLIIKSQRMKHRQSNYFICGKNLIATNIEPKNAQLGKMTIAEARNQQKSKEKAEQKAHVDKVYNNINSFKNKLPDGISFEKAVELCKYYDSLPYEVREMLEKMAS